ncbi:MAG: VWA domain-containing protein [Candidatus Acidoferrales bacterium]
MVRLRQRVACSLVMMFVLVWPGLGQEPGAVLRVEVKLVLVNVRVADPDGAPVLTLTQGDFRLFEDGREQAISVFEPLSISSHVALLIDTSASTQRDLELLKEAAAQFIEHLSADDKVAIFQVGPEVERLTEFTADRRVLEAALEKLTSATREGTLLYDALAESLRLFPPEARRPAMVVFSDGADEGSQVAYEELARQSLQRHAPLYAVLPGLGSAPAVGANESAAEEEWVIVFDLTATPRGDIRYMREAARELLEELSPKARVWLVDYRRQLRVLRSHERFVPPLTPAQARQALSRLGSPQPHRFAGRARTQFTGRNVLVLTDPNRTGLPRLSRYINLETAAIMMPKALEPARRKQLLGMLVHRRGQLYRLGWEKLKRSHQLMQGLTKETGGQAFEIGSLEELQDVYEQIAAQIRSSYTLGYYSQAEAGRHELRVEIPNQEVTVRAAQAVVIGE